MLDLVKSLDASAWVSVGGAIASLFGLLLNWFRSKAAAESNVISSTNAWAQALMKYVEKEIEYALEDQKCLKQLFQNHHVSPEDKQAIWKRLNETRGDSGRNLAFLGALNPTARLS